MDGSNFADDDVVISGLSIQLPEIDSLEKFSKTLFEGLPLNFNSTTEVIPDGYHGEFPKPAGKVAGANQLDTIFFGMNTASFLGTDRLQINALETSYVALMDAGINAIEAQNYMSQVYSCASKGDGESGDYSRKTTRYMILGNCRALAANRVSFFLDMKGHSTALDVGDSGGMASLEMGWRDIKEGRCDMAVVASGNIIVGEYFTISMNDLGWLCKSGNTRVFDNEADGFRRVECYATLILQRAKHAKRIYAKLSHVSCESLLNVSTSLMRPSRSCWVEFLERTYADCGIDKEKIAYLEAYATGIKDWDAAELNAVTEVFANSRKMPVMVGSVKSNIGNAEGSADLISIIKAIIALKYGKVPANSFYETPNTDIPGLIHKKLKVVDENWTLPEDSLIGVNSYSYGNLYGHCILEGLNKPQAAAVQEIPRLALLSARTDDLLPPIFRHIEEDVSYDKDFISLVHEIFKKDIPQHLGRGHIILSKEDKAISSCQAFGGEERPIWFVFSGMGSQWPGMGRDLMKLPLAQNSIQRCHDILENTAGLDLINILTADDPSMFTDNLNAFVGIAAVQIALVDILIALNIVPDGIIGHSLGELGCAYADGSLTSEQTILAAYYRGKAVREASLQRGAMAAVGRGYNQLKDELPENVELACHNSSTSSTISGLEDPVLKYVGELQAKSIFVKVVEVGNIGFHSQFIAPAGPYLLKYMKNVITTPKLRSSKWISSSVPEPDWKEEAALYASAEYFTNNLLRFVLFEEACAHVPENAILIEIAPHGLLQAIMKRSFPNGINIPITNREAPDNFIFLLQAIGKLYANGVTADVAALYTKPDFPVPTKTPSLHRLFPYCPSIKPTIRSPIACLSKRELYLRQLVKKCDKSMGEYDFRGQKVAPTSMYPTNPKNIENPFSITKLKIFKPFDLSISRDLIVEGMALPHSHIIEIAKNDTVLASAYVSSLEESVQTLKSTINSQATIISLTNDEFYAILAERGYFLPNSLRHIVSIDVSTREIRGTITKTNDWVKKLEAMLHMVYFNVSRLDNRMIAIKKIAAIDVDMINLDNETYEDLEVVYDIETNELACAGLYVKDVAYETHDNSDMFTIESTLPYTRPPLKTIHEYIECCGQIISNLKAGETLKNIKVLDLQQDKFPELSTITDATFTNVKEDRTPLSFTRKYDLLICTKKQLELHSSRLMEEYALVTGCENQDFGNFAAVSSFESNNGEKITLIKKKVTVNGDYLIIRIPEEDSDLIATLQQQPEPLCKKVLVVGKSEPNEGILNFIRRIQSQTVTNLRWMFILDDSPEEFNTSNPFYKQQLEKDLCLNVLLNGTWNFVYKKKVSTNEMNTIQGEITTCDNDVSWPMPASWKVGNKDETADAYAMAYHCIIAKADTKSYESVLITDGCSVIGQAAIAVALSKTNRVYVTVESKDEIRQLTAIFHQINPENILLHSDLNFVIKLRESLQNDFPNIVFNTLDGRVVYDLITFPSPSSKIFHLGKDGIENNQMIPTWQFQRYVSLIAMDMNNITKWHIEDKLEVRRLIDNGINTGVVKPLKSIKSKPCGSNSITRNQNIQRLGAKLCREHSFKVTSTGSYLVSGDASGVDLFIADWLIRRGAKNIFLLNTSPPKDSTYKKKLNLLSLHKNATVQIIDETAIKTFLRETDQDTSLLINDISDALNSELNQIIAISQNRQFLIKMQKYANSKILCTGIVWNKSKELLVTNLDVISTLIGGHTYFSVEDESCSGSSDAGAASYSDLIPSDLDSLHMLIGDLRKDVELVEFANAGHLMETCVPECQPVFLIPGMENESVELTKSLARGLLSPAFVAKIPNTNEKISITTFATAIVSVITKINDRKVYNLVGLSSGCVLTMEVARQLEKMGKIAAVLLVDNPLNMLQQSFFSESAIFHIYETMAASGDRMLELIPLEENWIVKASKHINDYFAAICNYDTADLKLKGPLTVVRSSTFKNEQIGYNDICIDSYIVDSPLDHKSLLCSKELQGIINKTVILEDVSPKTIHEPLWATFENVLENYRVLGKLSLDEKYVTY